MAMRRVIRVFALAALAALMGGVTVGAQNMPDPKTISGIARPADDVPQGGVVVRVIRGSFDHNVPNQPVEFVVNGKSQSIKTDAEGRATLSGAPLNAHVKASTVLDGQRLESQDMTMGPVGFRLMLVGTDPEAERRAAEDAKLAAGPSVSGLVVLGPESRIITQLTDERLDIFYVLQILNSARSPVDIGGPLVFNLPTEARNAGILDPAPKNASVSGARLTITGPFAPGATSLTVGFELPFTGGSVKLDQRWPAALQQVLVLVPQNGGIDVQSSALTGRRMASDQGQPLLVATGPGLAANADLSLEISGLPHHPLWPRYTALALAGGILTIGLWAAFVQVPRPRHA
jgi:hypothetical protein